MSARVPIAVPAASIVIGAGPQQNSHSDRFREPTLTHLEVPS